MVVGPQASGKSALASALSAELRRQGEPVALVELDQIAAMALPTLPDWDSARQIFEATTGMWARTKLTCVIAEGSGSQDEVVRLLSQAPPNAATVTVVTTAPFDVAFARAQADHTRGMSKEHDFLRTVYDGWVSEITRITADVLIDTSAHTLEHSVSQVLTAIRSARSNRVGR